MLMTLQWILLASLFIPMLTLLGIVWILRGIRSLAQERPPVSEKLLRPPGESLRRELEKIDDPTKRYPYPDDIRTSYVCSCLCYHERRGKAIGLFRCSRNSLLGGCCCRVHLRSLEIGLPDNSTRALPLGICRRACSCRGAESTDARPTKVRLLAPARRNRYQPVR
jgi:hypothetical protein